jgi:hypothetical protein
MSEKRIRKRLIEPKVRLLLWTHIHGIKNESNWLAKLAKEIDYSEGSVDTQLTDLLDKNLIESLNSNAVGPPYRVTNEGKKFLQPILFTTRIGAATTIWVGLWAVIYYSLFYSQPILMIAYWLPLLIVSFAILAVVLLFYPYLLLKLGKIGY